MLYIAYIFVEINFSRRLNDQVRKIIQKRMKKKKRREKPYYFICLEVIRAVPCHVIQSGIRFALHSKRDMILRRCNGVGVERKM